MDAQGRIHRVVKVAIRVIKDSFKGVTKGCPRGVILEVFNWMFQGSA